MKLRLRLPTDGSVDLDKLRAALEAQLQKNRQPVAEEPAVVEPVIVQPEPQPETRSCHQTLRRVGVG